MLEFATRSRVADNREPRKGAQMRWIVGLVLVVSAGCSRGSDAAPDGDIAPAAVVTIRTRTPPALLAIREEAEAQWRTLTPSGIATYETTVTGPYRVVVQCESGEVSMIQYARTTDEARSFDLFCGSADSLFHVRGEMPKPGLVALGGAGSSSFRSSWSFDLQVPAGTYDLLMFSGDDSTGYDQLGIRAGLTVAGDTELGSIDLAQYNPQPLVSTTFSVTNPLIGERLSANLAFFRDDRGTVVSSVRSNGADSVVSKLAPASFRSAIGTQAMSLVSVGMDSSAGAQRNYRRRVTLHDPPPGAAASAAQLDRIAGATFDATADRLSAHWTAMPPFDAITMVWSTVSPDGARRVNHESITSRAFREATGAANASATLDVPHAPGFQDTWRPDLTGSYAYTLLASVTSNGADASSAIVEAR